MPGLNTSVSTAGLSLNMFTISTLPVLLGVVVHQHRPEWCRRIHSWCERASSILMAVVVIATVINQWSLFTTNLTVLGPVLLSLNLLMLAIGLGVGHILRLPQTQVTTLSIESGFQNGSVGIVVGTLLTSGATASDLPAYSLPSAIYGVIMLFTIIPMVVWRRLQARSAAPAAELPGF